MITFSRVLLLSKQQFTVFYWEAFQNTSSADWCFIYKCTWPQSAEGWKRKVKFVWDLLIWEISALRNLSLLWHYRKKLHFVAVGDLISFTNIYKTFAW